MFKNILRNLLFIAIQFLLVILCQTWDDWFYIAITILLIISYIILKRKSPGIVSTMLVMAISENQQKISGKSPRTLHSIEIQNKSHQKVLQSSLILHKKKIQNSRSIGNQKLDNIHSPKSLDTKQVEERISKEEMKRIQEKEQIPQQDQTFYVEQLYCIQCMSDQTLRVRHCNQCHSCILTHDHHDIFLNQCIGEKNKFYFMMLLTMMITQLIYGTLLLYIKIIKIIKDENKAFLYKCGLGILIIFTLLILFEWLFHLYLILTNQTLSEYLHRQKLPYMKYVKEEIKKPFYKNICHSISIFINYSFKQNPQEWRFEQDQ